MRHALFSIVVLLVTLLASLTAGAQGRPNVLFILCDDMRWNAMSAAGHPALKTPNIDRLANDGVRFSNAFCTTSLCSPSRASILTGVYAHKHGVTNNFTELPTGRVHWPQRLRQEGYKTAYIGKWHMGEDNDAPRPGFDYFATHKGQGKYFDTAWSLNGKQAGAIKGYYTTVVTDLALDWLKAQPERKPWSLCIGHKAPHSFYTPEEKHAKAFEGVSVKYPESAFQLEDKPAWIKERLYTWHGIYGPLFEWRKKFPDDRPEAVKDFENMVHAYWGTILSVDDSVGRILKHLEETKQMENTVIVFMGDNGLLEGEHGMVDKRTAHEASLRIPLVVKFAGPTMPAMLKKEPRVIQQQVLTHDIAPSLLELCGAKPLEKIDGKSWVKLVREGDPNWRKGWFYEYNYEKQFPYTPNVRAVRMEDWKYIHYPHGDGSPDKHLAELYDLKNDPGERRNLIGDAKLAGKVTELKGELARLMSESGLTPEADKMPLDEGIKTALPDQKIR